MSCNPVVSHGLLQGLVLRQKLTTANVAYARTHLHMNSFLQPFALHVFKDRGAWQTVEILLQRPQADFGRQVTVESRDGYTGLGYTTLRP
jgi:hypothetical protein